MEKWEDQRVSLSTWVDKFKNGDYSGKKAANQVEAGWYDWFCPDSKLAAKTAKLGKKVCVIAKSRKVDPDSSYVFFKNNCPMIGTLYDDFRICDMETGDVIWTIIPSNGHAAKKGKAEVWGVINGFKCPVVEGSWDDVVEYFFTN